jgi:hypothetical protein
MPVQIIITEGLVSKATAQQIHHDISNLLLEAHQIVDNGFMKPNVIGEVIFAERGLTFAGQKTQDIAIVELRVPSFTFAEQSQKDLFVEKATRIVFEAANGALTLDQIWVNAVYAVDGFWGIAGKAHTNEQLLSAITAAAKTKAA